METHFSLQPFLLAVTLMLCMSCSRREVTFIQISDPQIGFFADNKDIVKDSVNLATAVEQINRLQPDFVVVTGDMVNSEKSARQLDCYAEVMSRIDDSIPVWQVPGNHDLGHGSTDAAIDSYVDRYGYQRFSFRYRGCAFIGINTCVIKDQNIQQEEDQYEWLEKQLKKYSENSDEIFVFSHYPFFIRRFDEKTGYSNLCMESRLRYWSLFKKYGVTAVVAGHLHDTVNSEYDGIVMYTAGPVGRPLGNGYSGLTVWRADPRTGTSSHEYISLEGMCAKVTL